MYRRKIGKKIFRRTRKHKFYGIKVKKGPSMLTRKRIRRGGLDGEDEDPAVVHSVIGNYASRSIFLNKEKCKDLLLNAIKAQRASPNKDIKYTLNALGDKKYCDDKYKTYIDHNVSEERKHQLREQTEQRKKDELEQQRQLEEQQKQREIDELEKQQKDKEEKERQQEQEQQDELERQQLEQDRELELQRQIQSNITPEEERKQQKQQLKKMLEQQLKSENKNTTFYIDNPGFKKFTAKNNHSLVIKFAGYKGRLSPIYDLIYEILKLIIFNKQHFFIDKLSTGIPGIITIAGIKTSVYIEVIKKLSKYTEKYDDFIIYYNSAVSEPEKFEIEEVIEEVGSLKIKKKKIVKDPTFLNMEKLLKLLYNFYDICLTDYVFYSLYIQILSYRLINLDDDKILDISNISSAVSEVFRSLYLEYTINNPILSTYDSDTLNDKKQNDINQLCYRLVHPLTPTEYDSRMNYEEPLKIINIQQDDQGYIKIEDPSFLENIPNVLPELEKIRMHNLQHKNEFLQVVELNRRFTSFETPTVINTKYTEYPNYDLYYFDMIDNVHNFLMKYNDIFCFSSSWVRGSKTEMDVRKNIQAIITPLIDKVEFHNLKFAEYMNPDIFGKDIMLQIIQLLNDNTVKTKTCETKTPVTRFLGYVVKYEEDANSKQAYFLKIFLNMIIYACYNQRIHGDNKNWNRKGTDLMIIYMNLFILEYLENILKSISELLKQQIGNLLEKTDYIFYDKMFTFIIPRVEEIQKNIETINLKKTVTFRKSVEYRNSLNFLPYFKFTYKSIKEQIDSHNYTVLGVMKFNEYNNPYVNPEKDKSVDKPPTLLKTMLGITLTSKNIEICSDVIGVLSSKISPEKAAEIITTSSDVFTFPDEKKNIKDTPGEYRAECKVRLANLINKARQAPKGVKYIIPRNMVDDIEICSNPDDVFGQKNNWGSGDREYIKRIGRAYYGIKEILLKADVSSKRLIRKIPNVKRLFEEVKRNETLQQKIRTQCIQDKDEEESFVNWKGLSDRRIHIRAGLDNDEIVALCNSDVSPDTTQEDEGVSLPYNVNAKHNPELKEYLDDLNEGAKLADENSRLRKQAAEEKRKIIEDLKKYNSKEEMLAHAEIVYRELDFVSRSEIDAALKKKGSFLSSLFEGGSKRRGRTIKRMRRQQKQHKTRKHGRKYRASRPNKKTRKHLVRGIGPGRIRPHRRTRSH